VGIDLLFETGRFNLSEVRPHFINPCCFGEDAAAWLRARLAERGIDADEPGQEDWGWYLGATCAGRVYFVGVGGNAAERAGDPNWGEWRVIVEKRRALVERLAGRERMTADDELVAVIRSILEAEPGIRDVRFEAGP
jgi:hypothetical protein